MWNVWRNDRSMYVGSFVWQNWNWVLLQEGIFTIEPKSDILGCTRIFFKLSHWPCYIVSSLALSGYLASVYKDSPITFKLFVGITFRFRSSAPGIEFFSILQVPSPQICIEAYDHPNLELGIQYTLRIVSAFSSCSQLKRNFISVPPILMLSFSLSTNRLHNLWLGKKDYGFLFPPSNLSCDQF